MTAEIIYNKITPPPSHPIVDIKKKLQVDTSGEIKVIIKQPKLIWFPRRSTLKYTRLWLSPRLLTGFPQDPKIIRFSLTFDFVRAHSSKSWIYLEIWIFNPSLHNWIPHLKGRPSVLQSPILDWRTGPQLSSESADLMLLLTLKRNWCPNCPFKNFSTYSLRPCRLCSCYCSAPQETSCWMKSSQPS